jgi:hypothetical protein
MSEHDDSDNSITNPGGRVSAIATPADLEAAAKLTELQDHVRANLPALHAQRLAELVAAEAAGAAYGGGDLGGLIEIVGGVLEGYAGEAGKPFVRGAVEAAKLGARELLK